MKAHQRVVRERREAEAAGEDLFGAYWNQIDVTMKQAELCEISLRDARQVIEEYEYLGTMCNAPIAAFGIRWGGYLGGVIVFGMPSPPNIASSAVDPEKARKVIQLGRGACVHWSHEHSASRLIAYGLREMGARGWEFAVAFADPGAGEIGTVYQATNWFYCGLTAVRPDYVGADGVRKVGHFKVTPDLTRVERRRKHRYLALLGDRRTRQRNRAHILWPVLAGYPKREDS